MSKRVNKGTHIREKISKAIVNSIEKQRKVSQNISSKLIVIIIMLCFINKKALINTSGIIIAFGVIMTIAFASLVYERRLKDDMAVAEKIKDGECEIKDGKVIKHSFFSIIIEVDDGKKEKLINLGQPKIKDLQVKDNCYVIYRNDYEGEFWVVKKLDTY